MRYLSCWVLECAFQLGLKDPSAIVAMCVYHSCGKCITLRNISMMGYQPVNHENWLHQCGQYMLFWDTGTGGHNLTSEGGAGVVEDEGCKAMLDLLLSHCSFPPFFFILFQQQGFKASIVSQRCVSFVATSILQSLRILPFLHLFSSLKVQKPSNIPISWSSAMYASAQSNKLDWEKKSAQQWNQFAEYQKIFLVFCNSLCLGCGSMSQSANGCVFFSVFNNVSNCSGWQESALSWNYSSTRRGEWHTISTICYKKTEFQQSMMQ